MGPLIYMNSKEKATIALGLANFTGKYGSTDVHLLMAASLVSMIPCLQVFFAAQKYFVESEFSAAVKG